jgi:hypothetical protein
LDFEIGFKVCGMLQEFTKRDRALFYHRQMPERIRRYLNGRGVPDGIINAKVLGWNGSRITIPLFSRDGEVLFFRFAKSPDDQSEAPKMLSEIGSGVELYGWETLVRKPYRVVICEGEFDRLVLEANGILAVTSTAGSTAFLPEWTPYFEAVKRIYVCFDRDEAGARGAETVKSLLPNAVIVTLPAEVGPRGDITDYFVRLGNGVADFEILLATAAAAVNDAAANPENEEEPDHAPREHPLAVRRPGDRRAEQVKREIPLDVVVRHFTDLKPDGSRLVGRCPFHDDKHPSFTVYPETGTYYCFGCKAHGDVIAFVMHKRSKTYRQALEELERLLYSDDFNSQQSA